MAKKKTAAKKTAKKSDFFATGKRGIRDVERTQFHIMLTLEERAKLVRLSRSMQLNAADVVRTLIAKAK